MIWTYSTCQVNQPKQKTLVLRFGHFKIRVPSYLFSHHKVSFFFLPSHKYVPNLHICKIDVQPLNFKLQTSNIQWLTQQSIHCCGAGDAWLWSVCAVSVVTVTDQFSLCVPSLLSLQMSLHRLLWASLQYQYNIMDLTRPWWWAEAAALMTLMACAAERHLLRPRPINQSRYSQQAYCRLHQLSSPRVFYEANFFFFPLHAWWQKITAFYFQEKKNKKKERQKLQHFKRIFFFLSSHRHNSRSHGDTGLVTERREKNEKTKDVREEKTEEMTGLEGCLENTVLIIARLKTQMFNCTRKYVMRNIFIRI